MRSGVLVTTGGWLGVLTARPEQTLVLRPEMFGSTGLSAEADTRAWSALARVASDRAAASGRVVIEAAGEYRIMGSRVRFTNTADLTLHLSGARFRQQVRHSKTISFVNCTAVTVEGGEGHGLGRTSGEYQGSVASFNGVAFLYFEDCDTVSVKGARGFGHAGGCFVVVGGRRRRFESCQATGIGAGPGGIPDPARVADADQRNGSDFGIMCIPNGLRSNPGWIFEDEFVNCRTRDSAFGIQTVQTRRCYGRGNHIGPHPGQHGVYGIDLDGVDWQSNTFEDCAQLAFKNQLENYAGRYFAEPWKAGASYAVGDHVRFNSILWEVTTQHRAGPAFDGSRFRISGWNTRNAGTFSNNAARRCLSGFAQIATPMVHGLNIVSSGWRIENNLIEDSTGEALRLDRMTDCQVRNNTIVGARGIGILAPDFSGSISENRISWTQDSAINVLPLGSTRIEDNRLINVAMGNGDEPARTPVVIAGASLRDSPDRPAAIEVDLHRNAILWEGPARNGQPATEPRARWLYLVTNPDVVLDTSDLVSDPGSPRTFSVPTSRIVRSSQRNRFAGFTDNLNSPLAPRR